MTTVQCLPEMAHSLHGYRVKTSMQIHIRKNTAT